MAEKNMELALLIRSEVDRAIKDVRRFRNEAKKNIDQTAASGKSATQVFGAFRGVLGALGVGFSVASIVQGIRAMVREASEAERIEGRLTAVMRATGREAEISAQKMFEMADALAERTRFTDDEAKSALAVLTTFTNIASSSFQQTLDIAAGLAAVMETDLRAAAQRLGKVLNNPVKEIEGLAENGIRFTAVQKEMIAQMVRTGDAAGAQKLILDELSARGLGSAAAGENVGLFKAVNDSTKAWDDLLEALGRTPTAQGAVSATLGAITFALKALEERAKANRLEFERMIGLAAPPAPRRLGGGSAEIDRERLAADLAAAGLSSGVRVRPEIGDESKKLIADMERRAQLLGLETEAQKVLFEVERGRFQHLNTAERAALVAAARRVDAAKVHQDQTKEEAEILKSIQSEWDAYQQTLDKAAISLRDTIDPARVLGRELDLLNELLRTGRITFEEYHEGSLRVFEGLKDLERGTEQVTDASKVFADQMRRNLQTAFADEIFNIITGNFDSIGDAFSNLLARMAAELAASQLLNALVKIFPSLAGTSAQVAHLGGIAGAPGAPTRAVSPLAFAGAPRLHSGGALGLRPDEIPAILQRGEVVLSRDDVRGGAMSVSVVIENKGAPIAARDTKVAFDPEGLVIKVFTEDVSRAGPMSRAMARTYNLRRSG